MQDMAIQSTIAQSMDLVGKANLDKTANAAKNAHLDMDKIDAAAKEFESVFISQMVNHMFEGIETDSMFGGGQAESIYRDMMIQKYGKLITEAGGIGIADSVKAEMIRMQEGTV